MADVFISYARQDREKAEALAEVLATKGWSVWWDRQLVPGDEFDETIERELAAARAVIVLWSRHSVVSDWVKTEAEEAAKRNILVPALVETVKVPLRYRRIQAADLIGWPAPQGRVDLGDVLLGVRYKLDRNRHDDAQGIPGTTVPSISDTEPEVEFFASSVPSTASEETQGPKRRRRILITLVAIAGVIVATATALILVRPSEKHETASASATVAVPGTQVWTDTGLDVDRGDNVTVTAAGEVVHSTENGDKCDPAGVVGDKYHGFNVVAGVGHCALLGRIGSEGDPFEVGRAVTLNAPRKGRLYLGVNDIGVHNNSGAFHALIEIQHPGRD